MKKIGIITGTIFILIFLGIFAISRWEDSSELTDKKTKVGCIFNGKCNDQSWTQSHYEALRQCQDTLNLELLLREEVPGNETCLEVMRSLIAQGCEIVVCNSYAYNDYIPQISSEYPEVYFLHTAGNSNENNVATFFGRIYQMRYLSGIVAGLQTKTNKIGYVAAYPIAEVNRGINAFTIGVRKVNPDAKVYIKWTNTWTDDGMTGDVTKQLLEKQPQIDVLAMHTDSLAVLDVAAEYGIDAIGYNMDNAKEYPDIFLTAPVWDWKWFYEPRIRECLQGKFQGKNYWEGADTGVVNLSPLTANVRPGISDVVEQEYKKLREDNFDVFYGLISDTEGKVRVKNGENMSDASLLNAFDWYVEGVVIADE